MTDSVSYIPKQILKPFYKINQYLIEKSGMVRKQTSFSSLQSIEIKHAYSWALLIYFVCVLSLAWPILQGEFLISKYSDQFRAGYAFREFAASYFHEQGKLPLWNPYLQGGMPFIAAMHGDLFYPTFLLRLILPVDMAMSLGMIIHLLLCGIATFAFTRVSLRTTFFSSLIGGLAYMMSGFVSSLVSAGHDGKLFVNALFPLLLLVLTYAIRDGKKWSWGLISLITGLAVLSPHPQLFQYMLIASAAWSLYLGYINYKQNELSIRISFQRLTLALVSVILGMLIGAIQFLSVFEYAAWSPRANGINYEFATAFSFPIEELINTFLPQFSGVLDNYWGRNQIHFHSEYIGISILILAGIGFVSRLEQSSRSFFKFWFWTGFVSLLWALGKFTPFYHLIYEFIPGNKYFRSPSSIFFITSFAIGMMAVTGVEQSIKGQLSKHYLIAWIVFVATMTLLAVSGLLTKFALSICNYSSIHKVNAGAAELKSGGIRTFVFTLLTISALLLIKNKRIFAATSIFLASICAIDLWTIDRLYWKSSPPANRLFKSDPIIEYLKQLEEPSRIIAEASTNEALSELDPYLHWDGFMVHRIRLTFGYHGNEIQRYSLFQDPKRATNPTTLALTNSNYIITNTDSLSIPGAEKVLGPITNSAGTRVFLFKLQVQHPFAWLAPGILKYPDKLTVEALERSNFPLNRLALISPESELAPIAIKSVPQPFSTKVQTTKYEPGHIIFELSEPTPADSMLVVSENYYPGWIATVDQKQIMPVRTDHVLIGVPLPKGSKNIELLFTSPAYEKGKCLSTIALSITILAIWIGLLFEKFIFSKGRTDVFSK